MFLVLGTVLDGAVMLLVFVPVLLPAAKSLGIDLVHFGVVVILNFMIAQITPPYGLILFVLSALTGVPMREINREIWQFCVPLTIVLLLLIAVPGDHALAAVGVRLQGLETSTRRALLEISSHARTKEKAGPLRARFSSCRRGTADNHLPEGNSWLHRSLNLGGTATGCLQRI